MVRRSANLSRAAQWRVRTVAECRYERGLERAGFRRCSAGGKRQDLLQPAIGSQPEKSYRSGRQYQLGGKRIYDQVRDGCWRGDAGQPAKTGMEGWNRGGGGNSVYFGRGCLVLL